MQEKRKKRIELTYGLLVVNDFKDMKDSEQRHFRKERKKLTEKINLFKIKNGVWMIPFEKQKPSQTEMEEFNRFQSLINRFKVKTKYFAISSIEIDRVVEDSNDLFDEMAMKLYYVMNPIKVQMEVEDRKKDHSFEINID